MPNPLSAIGFRAGTNQEFADLAERAAKDSTEIRVADGSYLLWECPSGAQLWLQLDSTGKLTGMNPHYRGTASLSVALSARISRQYGTPLDGAFYAYASPKGDLDSGGVPEDYYYPFVFDCPDFACYAGRTLPLRAMAQVTAFAHEFSLFWTKADLDAVRSHGWRGAADQHFIPSGLFLPSGEAIDPPESTGVLGGYVRTAKERVNRMTGLRFLAIEIESYGGDYTVVVDPTLTDRIPPPGSIVAGHFWLSGRVVLLSS